MTPAARCWRCSVIDLPGQQRGLRAGYPVIGRNVAYRPDHAVARRQSRVTLPTDKDQAIPVQVVRNGLRSAAFGGYRAPGQLDLRFSGYASADLPARRSSSHLAWIGTYPRLAGGRRSRTSNARRHGLLARDMASRVAGVRSHRQPLVVRDGVRAGAAPGRTRTKPQQGRARCALGGGLRQVPRRKKIGGENGGNSATEPAR